MATLSAFWALANVARGHGPPASLGSASGLDRLELCRLRCNSMTCFKSIRGFNFLRSEEFFTLCAGEQITRGNPFKLRIRNFKLCSCYSWLCRDLIG